MALELGAGYVTLLPSARGFGAKVRALTTREMRGAGNEAASRFTSEMASTASRSGGRFTSAMAVHTKRVADQAGRDGARAGSRFGDSFASKIKDGMKVAAAASAVGVAALVKTSVDAASEAEQSMGAVDAIFKDKAKSIQEAAKNSANAVGISANEYRNLASTLGAQLKNKGIEDFAGQTQSLISLGADLSAQFGGSSKEAVEALTSALRGETDPIERYGVSLNAAAIEAQAASMGIQKVNGQLPDQGKAMAALALINKQTADAQGAFNRETDTYANKMQKAKASAENMKASLGSILLPAFTAVADYVNTNVLPAVSTFIQGMKDGTGAGGQFAAFLRALVPFLAPAASALGAMAAAFVAYRVGAVLAKVATTNLWTAIAANPVGAIIAAIGLLVGALVYLYQNNDKARAMMTTAWTAIKTAVMTAWTNYIQPALVALWTFIRDVLIPWVQRLWSGTIYPAFLAIGAWIARTWSSVIRPALSALWAFIRDVVAPGIMWLWHNIIVPAFKAIGAYISFWWNVVAKPILTLFWGFIKNIVAPIVMWLWRNVVAPAFKAIGSIISVAWRSVIKPALDALSNAIKAMPGLFDKAQKGIAKAWSAIKAAALKPVEFVVQTVLNFGLIEGMNKILKTFKAPTIPYIPWTAKLATGGIVPGHSPNATADNIPAMLTAGEFVTRYHSAQRMRKKHPGVLEYINEHGDLPRYARGGWAKPWPMAVGAAVRKIFGHKGAQGGYGPRPGPSDHGSGNAIDFMVPDSSPLGDAIAAWGVANHEALRLKYIIWKKRIIGSGQWGKGWRPYTRYGNSPNRTLQHYDHPHFSFEHDRMGNPAVLLKGLSAEMIKSIMAGAASIGDGFGFVNPFEALITKATEGLKKFAGSDTPVGQIASGIAHKALTAIPNWAMKVVSPFMGGGASVDNPNVADPGGSGVQRWAPLVRQALGMVGEPESLVGVVLRRLNQESGGNPRAVNNWDINAKRGDPSKGLMQVIGGTFRQYAMPGYNSNIFDPLSNILASMRYAKSRYGSLAAAYNRRGGYASGGWIKPTLYDTGGILAPGLTLVSNQTNKPETVRTYEQEKALQASLQSDGGTVININGIKHDSVSEFANELNFALTRRANSRRYGKG